MNNRSSRASSGPPVCAEDVHKFLYSSCSHFVGETQGEDYQLRGAFPTHGKVDRLFLHSPNPYKICHFALSVRLPLEERQGNFQIVETYSFVGEQFATLLTGFYGKLVRSCGHIQQGFQIRVPDLDQSLSAAFHEAPFNDLPRKPHGPALNLKEADHLLVCYLFAPLDRATLSNILRASSFYQLALENWSRRPELCYTLLISAVESLLDLRAYSDEELFDPSRLADFEEIAKSLPAGEKIVSRLRGALRSVKRKFLVFVIERLPPEFFEELECDHPWMGIPRDCLESALKAAYDLRSEYLHTGDTEGISYPARVPEGSERMLSEPEMDSSRRRNLVSKAPSLTGLERMVASILHGEIRNWVSRSYSDLLSQEKPSPEDEIDFSI